MTQCIKLDQPKTQVCIGAMRHQIQILQRTLNSPFDPIGGNYESNEEFEVIATTWAMIKTTRGVVEFDDIEQNRNVITTLFYIRYLDDISEENWILYEDNYYDILTVKDYELRHTFLELACSLSGDYGKKANTA